MDHTISVTRRTARKEHECNACLWLFNSPARLYRDFGGTISEYRAVAKAKAQKGMIVPGEQYYEVVGVFEGEVIRVRQKPDIHDICMKYNFYE